ncbi:MAG: ATP-dependent Clp protease ATP-binding subunit [bacterium]
MNIIDRFSTHLREALTRSITLATELQNAYVEPVHLMFALVSIKGSTASEIISRIGIDHKTIEQCVLTLPVMPKKKTTDKKVATLELSSLSRSARMTVEKAMILAHAKKHNYVGTEHLLFALLEINDPLVNQILKTNSVSKKKISEQIQIMLDNASSFPQVNEIADTINNITNNLDPDSMPFNGPTPGANAIGIGVHNMAGFGRPQKALEVFATCLTNPKIQDAIDPVIGRQKEIERMCQILCRRHKNNPVLLGDPGVGKTAIVEGLAKKIMAGEAPGALLRKKIYALDMGMLIAGTTFRGEFESRLQHIMAEVSSDPDIILFIDEIHNIVGAGSNHGAMDASNILKPALARGQIRCIGATTPGEFKKYIESDPALERRFQPIYLKESSIDDTIKILKGIRKNYENFHSFKITDQAIEVASKLADQYLTGKFMPDKAIDLMDECMAAKKLTIKPSPKQNKIWELQKEIEIMINKKEQAALSDDFKKAVKLKEKQAQLTNRLQKIMKNGDNDSALIQLGTITANDIMIQLSKIIDVPLEKISNSNQNRFANLKSEIKKTIIGQDKAIDEVVDLVARSELNLTNPNRPRASIMLAGLSGTGKTELAKTLAQSLYPGSDGLIRLDMNEFNESYSVSKLLGSPAGYVGYKESNRFTDKIKMNPHCIILLDEIDKAHNDISKLFLQMLEDGEVTDSEGRKISLKHAIIIMTTSIGARQALKKGIGFGDSDNIKQRQEIVEQELKEHFGEEFIKRMDKIILFNDLNDKDLKKIANLEISALNEQLKIHKTKLEAGDAIISRLIKRIPQNQANARDMRTLVRAELEKLITNIILKGVIKTQYKAKIKSGKLSLE